MNKENKQNKQDKSSKSKYFLLGVIVTYLILFFIKKDLFFSSINLFGDIFLKVIPIFALIFVLMVISDYFISPKFIMKHLKDKGAKKWFFIIIGGILSSGPIYMWYPLLKDLKKKGMSDGLIASFLYNRAIKIPLLPLAAIYFGWKYIIVLSLVMVFVSVIQGRILNKILEQKK